MNTRLYRRIEQMQGQRARARDRESRLSERIAEVRGRHRRMQAEGDHAILALISIGDGALEAAEIASAALDVIRSNTTDSPRFTETG